MLQPSRVPGRQEPVQLLNGGFVADEDGPCLEGAVPELGADTDAVLHELGYSDDAIRRLRDQGAI
jgi:crotonobetainyl-CoA:carnitine CoA-transferase CaiB-like acyl-CoA transferase